MKKSCVCLLFGLFLGLIQISCSDENDEKEALYKLKTTAITIRTGKTLQLEVEPATGWTFSSKNSNIATVSDSGVVTTHYVGTTMVYVRHEAGHFIDSVKVTAEPRFTLYGEPYLNFRVTEETVRSSESGVFSNRYLDPKGQGAFYLIYTRTTDNTSQDVYYHFDNNSKYDFSEIRIHPVHAFETTEHLTERYLFICKKKYTELIDDASYQYSDSHYISPDSTMLVCMTYESIRFSFKIEYRPYTVQTMNAILCDSIGKVYNR